MRARSLCTLALAITTTAAACGSSSSGTGTGGTSGGGHAGTGTGSGGTSAAGTAGTTGSGTGGTSVAGTAGTTGTGTGGTGTGTGGTGTGGSTATGTAGTTGGGGAGATGTAGSSGGGTGAAGTTGSGTGGSTAGGGHGGTGSAGTTGTAGTTGSGGAAAFCPAGAIFCADFEEASGVPMNNPVGTATFEDPSEFGWTFGGATMAAMQLDTASPHSGKQSLKVNASSGFAIRTLAVAVPATFWVRLYIKGTIGAPDHNSFFAAGTSPIYSTANNVELSEQFGCILLNKSDSLFPTGTTCGANTALTGTDWHCMAAEFDGTTGNVQVFSGTTMIINAQAWAPAKETFNTFSFGYFAYNEPATVSYDDVVVSASPLSCP